ncbi:hypothetical protein ACB092_11G150400 [Castanea dentata]
MPPPLATSLATDLLEVLLYPPIWSLSLTLASQQHPHHLFLQGGFGLDHQSPTPHRSQTSSHQETRT